jgi:hypothetical protein
MSAKNQPHAYPDGNVATGVPPAAAAADPGDSSPSASQSPKKATSRAHSESERPSANGVSSQQDGRQPNGQFAKGNRGGPGNPYARRVAELRKMMIECATDERMRAIVIAVLDKPAEGNMQAAKLAFQYIYGKPTDSAHPDRIDQDEWRNMQEDSNMMRQIDMLTNTPEPDLAVGLGRSMRLAGTLLWRQEMLDRLDHPEKYREAIPELVVPRPRKANGKNGPKGGDDAGGPVADAPGSAFGAQLGGPAYAGVERVSVFGSPSANGKPGGHQRHR